MGLRCLWRSQLYAVGVMTRVPWLHSPWECALLSLQASGSGLPGSSHPTELAHSSPVKCVHVCRRGALGTNPGAFHRLGKGFHLRDGRQSLDLSWQRGFWGQWELDRQVEGTSARGLACRDP